MNKTIIIIGLLIVSSCAQPSPETKPVSSLETAVDNLSVTTEQLTSIQKEKDLFVKALEDFESQRAKNPYFLNDDWINTQMQNFDDWHRDIEQRERNLEFIHALNVYSAHREAAKRRVSDLNNILSADTPIIIGLP